VPAVSVASATPVNKKGQSVAKKTTRKTEAKKDATKTPAVAKAPAKTPAPKPAPPEFRVENDARVVFLGKTASATTFKLQPPPGWVSAIRVELLPHEQHQGSIVRSGASNSMSLKLTASLRQSGATKDTALAFRHADADLKEPRYRETEEIIGVKNLWKTAEKDSSKPHTAVWLLDQPVKLAEGDALTVKLDGNNAGCVRVSVSPFVPRQPLAAEAMRAVRAALGKDSAEAKILVAETYLASTGFDNEALAAYKITFTKLLECRNGKAWTMVTKSIEPMTIRVLARGNWMDDSGAVVSPASPAFLPGGITSAPDKRATRLDFAKWLCSPENPLTARAVMNRLWKQFFGNGLSAVVDDLGAQGEPPSHPELLDWLAVEFANPAEGRLPSRPGGTDAAAPWDFKHMVKTIVMSATYRQSSSLRPELKDIDPNNRLLASQNPRRLDAEFVRDNALFIAGLLNLADLGGPSVKPYQPAGYYANLQFPNRDYASDADDRQWRRGLYMHWQRTFLHPMLANFDAPPRDECTANRTASNTPQQALTLLNDPSFVEAARVFAGKVLASPAKSDEARIDLAFQRAVGRPAKMKEKASLTGFIAEQREQFRASPADAEKLLKVGLAPQPPFQNRAELAAWTSLCRVVLNLQETITRY
jgi:hypothetical protein